VIDAAPQKRMRPAAADAANGPRVDQLARTIDPTNNPKPAELQAPDDAGESDLAFFIKRPDARHRIRSAFENEFPDEFLKQRGGRTAVVIVAIERDAAGRPTTRGRGLVFPDGGTA
jgi:hypothetical protein